MVSNTATLIQSRVNELFVSGDYNCAMMSLTMLFEVFHAPVSQQIVSTAQVMPGAGGVGGLCDLLSGGLVFIGAGVVFTAIRGQIFGR